MKLIDRFLESNPVLVVFGGIFLITIGWGLLKAGVCGG
jgi:predicted tellurium resistance membrane protein TerC